jgi:VWFA-related protein
MYKQSKCKAIFFPVVGLVVLLGLSRELSFSQTQAGVDAQPSAPGGNSQQAAPTFRASTRLVLVDVVVTDKSGQTAKGLKATDFIVLEDGKPQPVRAFESHVWQRTTASVEKINMPPNQYTNFTEQDPNSAVNVVLLDVLNTPQQDQQYARKQMIEFLHNLPPGQKIALFVLGTKLRMMQGFTGDSERLVKAAEMILSNTSPVLTTESQYQDTVSDIAYFADTASANGGSLGILKANLIAALNAEVAAQANMRARMTMDALSSLAGAVSGYSGRKNLFWLSGNFPFRLGPDFSNDPIRSPDNYAGAIRETAALLLATQIAVYPIDARGVQTNSVSASARPQALIGSANDQVSLAQNRTYNDYADTKGAMDDIARETGGQAFIGNDLKKIMERGIEQGSTYYTLAYSPAIKKWDGEYHKIEVKTAESGLKLEFRRGYYAVPEREVPGDQAGTLLFAAMQPSVPESTLLLMRVQVLMPDKDHDKIRIDYAVAPQDISFVDSKDGRKHGVIDFVAALYNKDGRDIGHAVDSMNTNIRSEVFEQVLKTGIPMHQEIDLKPGAYLLRLGVMDRSSRKIGTVDVPLNTAGAQRAAAK